VAKTYRLGLGKRWINSVFAAMTRLGVGASYRHLLTVQGRKSGRMYTTPVDVMTVVSHRYLVAGYGMVSWVRNVRASQEATLRRGRRSASYRVEETGPEEALPVLREYMRRVRVTARYFDVGPDAPDASVAREVPRHPVFRLVPARDDG